MKFTITILSLAALLTGCGTTSNNPTLTPSLVTIAVETGVAFGVEKYPQAVPALRVATPVVCAAAAGTNVSPAQIVSALTAAGVSTNAEASIIMNGALAIYETIFETYGSAWVQNQPTLVLYLKAVCDGLTAGLPPTGSARITAKSLLPHL